MTDWCLPWGRHRAGFSPPMAWTAFSNYVIRMTRRAFAPPPPMEDLVDDVELEEEEEVVELWKVEKQPVPTKRAVPQYPDIARKANITGKVFVTALIDKTGKVEAIGKITGPEVFHEAARAAAVKWEFEPAIQNDKPVKVWVSLPFTFQLN